MHTKRIDLQDHELNFDKFISMKPHYMFLLRSGGWDA